MEPECLHDNAKVWDSRFRAGRTYRRRQCLRCGARFSTVEIDADKFRDIINNLQQLINWTGCRNEKRN